MKCIISNKETTRRIKEIPVSKEVVEFARWYRDKLNVQQKQKMRIAKRYSKKAIIDLTTCLNTFVEMRNKKYSWESIQNTILDELMLKGLIDDQEYNEKNITSDQINQTEI